LISITQPQSKTLSRLDAMAIIRLHANANVF